LVAGHVTDPQGTTPGDAELANGGRTGPADATLASAGTSVFPFEHAQSATGSIDATTTRSTAAVPFGMGRRYGIAQDWAKK
jgi:hypothetical protein